MGRRHVLEAVGGGGGLEEVGVHGGGRLGAEAEREGQLEVVGLLRLLRPALATVAARRAVRVPVLAVGEGGDGGRALHLVAADAAPAGLPLQPHHPVHHGELGAGPRRRLVVERGGRAVVVGRGRGRVVRRAPVVADAGGRGCGEQGVRRRGGGGAPSPRCAPRRPLGRDGVPHRLAVPSPARGAGGGGGRGARRQLLRIKSIDLARPIPWRALLRAFLTRPEFACEGAALTGRQVGELGSRARSRSSRMARVGFSEHVETGEGHRAARTGRWTRARDGWARGKETRREHDG